MLKSYPSGLLPITAWLVSVAVLGAISVGIGATTSTTVSLLVLGTSPILVMWLLVQHAAPPTVAEILYAARQKP